MTKKISINEVRSIPFLLLATIVGQWIRKVLMKKSGLNLECILYGSGVLRVGIEGLFGEGDTVLPVNKYYG